MERRAWGGFWRRHLGQCLLVLLTASCWSAAAAGCSSPQQRHRHLLDDSTAAGAPAASSPAAAVAVLAAGPSPASPAAASASGSTVIDALLDQKCAMMHHALVAGTVLVNGSANLQPDEAACCASCLARGDACTAWVYCPRPGGCTAYGAANATRLVRRGSGEAAAPTQDEQRRQLQLPHRGCRLLSIDAFRLRKDSPQILAKGSDVDFISGTPVTITLPSVSGYRVRPSTDTAAGLGYKCAESLLLHSCLLQGQVEELAAMCDADPLCKAFVYLPNGIDSFSEPIGIFKGGPDMQSIPVTALASNPSTALYIKSSVDLTTSDTTGRWPPASGDGSSSTSSGSGGGDHGGGGGSTNVLWIVLPTLLASALLLVAAVLAYATVAMKQQGRRQVSGVAAPDGPKLGRTSSHNSSGSGRGATPNSGSSAAGATSPAAVSGIAAAAAAVPSAPPQQQQQQQPAGLAPPLVVQLPKPLPPHSGGSSDGGGGSPAVSTRSNASSGCMQCPQCGTALSLRYRHAAQPPPQQQQQQQLLQQQRALQQPAAAAPPPA